MQHHGRVGADVIEHRCGFIEEQRQVVLDAGCRHPVADVLIDAALGRVTFEQFAPAAAESRAGVVVHRKLAAGQQSHLGHRIQAALTVRIEGADGIDFVVEQVDAVRHRRSHREQVDQPAAHRIFAGTHHLRDMAVPGKRELGLQLCFLELLLDLELEGVSGEEARRRHAVQHRGGRHDDDVCLTLRDAPERRQPFADQVLVRRKAVVGQRFPIRKEGAAQVWREKCHLFQQPLRIRRVGGDDGGEFASPAFAFGQLRDQQSIGGTGRSRQCEAFAGAEFG
jgi:hypothetical protein